MLKKTLKKLIATALAVATVATTMVAPVSASTLTPKKSHSEAEITEYVDYFNDITYPYTFRPDRYVPALLNCGSSGTHKSYTYKAWQMTERGYEDSSSYMEKVLLIRANALHVPD